MFTNQNTFIQIFIAKIINKIMTCKVKSPAFTLVELGVVLTIIAMGIGLLSLGNSLVYKYKLKTVMEDFTRFTRAYVSFKDIYKAVPGDMFNATTAFGATAPSGLAVQNGNGNGFIGMGTVENVEMFAGFQHLSLAGLINGEYTGTYTLVSTVPSFPQSRYYSQAGYSFASSTCPACGIQFFNPAFSNNTYFNFIYMNAPVAVAGSYTWAAWWQVFVNGAMRAPDAQALDIIYDDGYPSTGSFLTSVPNNSPNGTGHCINYSVVPYIYAAQGNTVGNTTYNPLQYTCIVAVVLDQHNL